ncbi:hypothetical protein Dip518_001300 [Parelusimicrobium proximum]|uniref:hypothetical protein n=1 Tax=Parelusimicrobium proximum TaxID=3228953 RepID=UPI003D16D014
MKNFITFLMLCFLVFLGVNTYKGIHQEHFAITGEVQVPERLKKSAEGTNNTCSIIVKNEADVPVAIKRVINPTFPLAFNISKEDFFVPEWEGKIKIDVEINNHGNLGVFKAGDIFGSADGTYEPNAKNIVVTADKMTGRPKLASTRGNTFFRSAAR